MPKYKYPWREQVHQALLETDRTELQRKIQLADDVVHTRIEELAIRADVDVLEEKDALRDAVQALRLFKRLRSNAATVQQK